MAGTVWNNEGGVDPDFVWTYQLWESPDGTTWIVTMGNDGTLTTSSFSYRGTEAGQQRATEDGRARITET